MPLKSYDGLGSQPYHRYTTDHLVLEIIQLMYWATCGHRMTTSICVSQLPAHVTPPSSIWSVHLFILHRRSAEHGVVSNRR